MGMHLFGGLEFMVMGYEATICLLPPVFDICTFDTAFDN
jgi:hypothetical protein